MHSLLHSGDFCTEIALLIGHARQYPFLKSGFAYRWTNVQVGLTVGASTLVSAANRHILANKVPYHLVVYNAGMQTLQ